MSEDLTTCKTCGMRWSAHPKEVCPRCDLVDVVERLEKAQREALYSERRVEEARHEIEMAELDRLGPRI